MADPVGSVQEMIDRLAAPGQRVRLLEAGCGSMSKVRLPANVEVVGIDISARQLARNEGLHERILADIQTYRLPAQAFDIIICWDVLEHLEHPGQALRNFFRAARPGGLIILAFPNLFSLKGVITKLTPHAVHVWYYRRLLHVPDAGKEDTPPFETQLRADATYPAIRRLAADHNAAVALFALRESHDMRYVRAHFPLMNAVMRTASLLSRLLTFGRVDAMHSDCIMVLRAAAA